jgi:hypothetical protein
MLVLLTGCQQRESLAFEPLEIKNTACSDCPEVKISLPEAMGKSKVAGNINTALTEEVIAMLVFDDSTSVSSLGEAMASFERGYTQMKALYPDEAAGWKAEINAVVSFEDPERLSIKLDAYTFTGGAHGYGATRYLNFDKKKGAELEPWELFKDQEAFVRYAESIFRLQEKIPSGQGINSTGFMFEQDKFYLPENIGFTKHGLLLHYNQYEVASFADGPVELTLPFEEVNKFLVHPVKW